MAWASSEGRDMLHSIEEDGSYHISNFPESLRTWFQKYIEKGLNGCAVETRTLRKTSSTDFYELK